MKDVRQVLIDDQEIALKNKVFEKELKEAVGSASYMFPVYGFLKMKVAGQSIANETNIDLSQPVLTNNISLKDDAELKVKTTQHININAKAGKPAPEVALRSVVMLEDYSHKVLEEGKYLPLEF